ncbi:uncharacterized protein F4812DRAFT_447753 [Daldinia caldariorum]|uniref:uncharacterized protein n=1 Tax=Daldinia caldariorum TaxID=326644 RepID=UPI0020087ED7|nr:uncharacterized protein F4812DRAFT_447753 [Daldinia caldariorum]KAI1463132.1 hypothetical protein F4812DRAFT_447753 [Daldinia caldariorum]
MCSFLIPVTFRYTPTFDPSPPFQLLLSHIISRNPLILTQPQGIPMPSNVIMPPPVSRVVYEVPPPHIYNPLYPARDAPGPPNRPLPKPPVRPKYRVGGPAVVYPTTVLRPVAVLRPTSPPMDVETGVPAPRVPLAPNAVLLRRIV